MKDTIIAVAVVSALALSPVFGAPGKSKSPVSTESFKGSSAPSTPAVEGKAASEKATSEKATPEKAASGKATSGKATSRKAASKKGTPEKAGPGELAADLTATQKSKMLTLLNEGTAEDLGAIKGVSKTRAAAIEKARPFGSIDEVIRVSGIGKATVSGIVSHARALTSTPNKSASPPSSASSKKKKS